MDNRHSTLYLGGLCLLLHRGSRVKPAFDMAMDAISGGLKWLQFRDKEASRLQMFKTARLLRALTIANDVTLIINDYPDIALAVDADGVHLGQDDLPVEQVRRLMGDNKIIGVSTHSLDQALEAQRGGADYIGFGPIFATQTKDAGSPKGVDAIRELLAQIKIPIVAIGGISEDSLGAVLDAGASAVAVASGILEQEDLTKAVEAYVGIIIGQNSPDMINGLTSSK
ncbi:MAG: thiamine phosphate synthase [Nitrospirae bacterium]|uniref:thiamine phosphate synthase n=1 Tax=Candidatus Magnetobacterium casense TaxID=1455061 RepID=UPI0009DE87FD|nr:thiamine phosphate synthase [Candidatus Magnetobacterium casensis]MBF0338643.1 thiamine phosphate synthase [Nitrospirota bacterium]